MSGVQQLHSGPGLKVGQKRNRTGIRVRQLCKNLQLTLTLWQFIAYQHELILRCQTQRESEGQVPTTRSNST
eukprot:683826-Pelagomonas_calceolata.AAC.4